MMAVVSVSLFFLYFLCLWSLQLGVTSAEKLLCLLCKTILKVNYLIIILWIFLEKGGCFDFNHSLGCVYPTMYIIRLLCRFYHFSLLICYPSSSLKVQFKHSNLVKPGLHFLMECFVCAENKRLFQMKWNRAGLASYENL